MTDMEAAREAAAKEYNELDGEPALQQAFAIGFNAGYNAAQPKPCVWTHKECPCCMTTQCGKNTAAARFNKNSPYCSHCGGKIEVSE